MVAERTDTRLTSANGIAVVSNGLTSWSTPEVTRTRGRSMNA